MKLKWCHFYLITKFHQINIFKPQFLNAASNKVAERTARKEVGGANLETI